MTLKCNWKDDIFIIMFLNILLYTFGSFFYKVHLKSLFCVKIFWHALKKYTF